VNLDKGSKSATLSPDYTGHYGVSK